MSLVAQWLRLHAPNAEGLGVILGHKDVGTWPHILQLRVHMPQLRPSCCSVTHWCPTLCNPMDYSMGFFFFSAYRIF